MSLIKIPAGPSCSGSSSLRKRRNSADSTESTGVKLSRPNYYFVLESSSDIPTSEEDTESFLSWQNKSTDFAKDTSDTSTKPSRYGSDFEVEFEVVTPSLSEHDSNVPFDKSSSGTDVEVSKTKLYLSDESNCSEKSNWADSSSVEGSDDFTVPARNRRCLKCLLPTNVQYCHRCYKVRKDFFPPRPKQNKRKKVTRPNFKRKGPKATPVKTPATDEKVESGIESGSSQELSLSLEEKPDPPTGGDLCNICFKNQKDGAFVHCRWVHIYACYQCSLKVWFSSRCCPLCNGKVNKVLKVAIG